MVTLFMSHIWPIMNFCSNVWNVGYLSDIRLLKTVQRRLTREIADVQSSCVCERTEHSGAVLSLVDC